MTLAEIKDLVREMDSWPENEEQDPAFKVAVLLMATMEVGPVASALRRFTGYSQTFVYGVWRRLRDNGVFIGPERGKAKRFVVMDWINEDTGPISFWLDILVGLGEIERISDQGECKYRKLQEEKRHARQAN